MPDQLTNGGAPETTRERFHRTLLERAQGIKCVRNDVYTVKYWQLALNFILGAGAVVLLVLYMIMDAPVSTACLISALAAVVAVVALNLALRVVAPMSFLQYTAIENGKRYTFMILSRHRSLFTNGEDTVELDHLEYVKSAAAPFPQYRFDFFADMDVDVRIGKADREIFKGVFECDGKKYKSKIVFKNGAPYVGTVGGARIKYFDVNDTKEKFVVPEGLKKSAEAFEVPFPKLAGVHIQGDRLNARTQ